MTEIMVNHFLILLFIFIRITAAFFTAPLYSNQSVPVMVRVAVAMVVAYIIFSFIDKSTIELEVTMWFIFSNVIKEIITGAVLGFSINLLFYAISFAGSIMGFDIGLAMAQVFNPIEEMTSNLVGQIFHTLAILVFLIINGHHYIISAINYSFTVVPIGYFTITEDVYDYIIKMGATVFILAVKIASPILVSYFLVHIAEGILARIIPQMQVFFVTYPLKIGLGIFLIIVSLPVYVYVIKNLLSLYEEKLYQLIQLMV